MVISSVIRSIKESRFGQGACVKPSQALLGCFGTLNNYVKWVFDSKYVIGFKLESLTFASLRTIIFLIKSTAPKWCYNI